MGARSLLVGCGFSRLDNGVEDVCWRRGSICVGSMGCEGAGGHCVGFVFAAEFSCAGATELRDDSVGVGGSVLDSGALVSTVGMCSVAGAGVFTAVRPLPAALLRTARPRSAMVPAAHHELRSRSSSRTHCGRAVDVHFEAPRAEVAVHDAKGDAEGVGDDGERREEFGGFGVEEVDYAGCGEGLADVRRGGFYGRVDGEGFVGGHAHCVVEEGEEACGR
jgi:hypothetical protein